MKAAVLVLTLLCMTTAGKVLALGMPQIEYMTKQEFLDQAFAGQEPAWEMLRLNRELKAQVKSILGHAYKGSRIRYWHNGSRTAWIVDEIGKEYPITMGMVVENNALVSVNILVYREERGGEVHQEFFTRQFIGARKQDDGITHQIDNITGATLSVDAVTRVAELVLSLHQWVQPEQVANH